MLHRMIRQIKGSSDRLRCAFVVRLSLRRVRLGSPEIVTDLVKESLQFS